MIDKVQKIREEVERLMNELIREKEKGFGSDVDDACILELQNVLTYIDSLQEEPVNTLKLSNVERTIKNWKEEPVRNPIDFEQELYKAFGQVKDFTLGMRIAKWFYDVGKKSREPVSEDFKEFEVEYIEREKDNIVCVYDRHAGLVDGAKWQKEQMMTKAVDAKLL